MVPHLPGEGRPRTRPEYFTCLPAGLEATGETVALDELLDYWTSADAHMFGVTLSMNQCGKSLISVKALAL